MFLNINTPVYNTIIVFTIIIVLLYVTKPNIIYDHRKKEFREFGTKNGKTLLPIYILSILIAIIVYVIFYYMASIKNKSTKPIMVNDIPINNDKIHMQQQIQYLQNQIQCLANQQTLEQIARTNMASGNNTVIKSSLPNNLNI
jgi:hypothetical protein